MILLIRFFNTYAPLVYLVLAVGLLFAIRGLIHSMREKRMAIFGLEQEISHTHMRASIAGLIVVLLLALGEVILQGFLSSSLPAVDMLSTPTLGLLTIPTTPLEAPGSVITIASPVSEVSGCITGQIMIDAPKPGEAISGDIIIVGTADIPNFGFYKYEFTPSGTTNWATILAGRNIVRNGELGHWDTSQLATGDYLLQLVVTDNQGNAMPACIVPVRISTQ